MGECIEIVLVSEEISKYCMTPICFQEKKKPMFMGMDKTCFAKKKAIDRNNDSTTIENSTEGNSLFLLFQTLWENIQKSSDSPKFELSGENENDRKDTTP